MYKRSAIFVLLLLVAVIVSCGESKAERDSKTPKTTGEVAKLQKEGVMKELVGRHNALTDWDKGVIRYTIQLQEVLVDSGRPVFFCGYVNDIFRKNGQCYIRLKKTWIQDLSFDESLLKSLSDIVNIHFILKCNCDKAYEVVRKQINKKRDNSVYNNVAFVLDKDAPVYGVVARVHNIVRPVLRVNADAYLEYFGENPYCAIDLDYEPPDTFVVLGDCIDLSYIGGSYLGR